MTSTVNRHARRLARRALLSAALLALAAAPALAALVPLRAVPTDFQVNAGWSGTQERGFVRVAPDGVTFVFFHSEQEFRLRIFEADGTPRTGDILTAAHEGRFEGWPSVWIHPDGFLLIEWSKSSWMTTVGTWVQAFDRNGVEVLAPTSIIPGQSGLARGRYVPLPNGKFMVAWPEDDGDGRAGILAKQGTWQGAISTWHTDDAELAMTGLADFGALPSGDGYFAVWTSQRLDGSYQQPVWVSWLDSKGQHEESLVALDQSSGNILAAGATPGRVRFLLRDSPGFEAEHSLITLTRSSGAVSRIALPDLSGYKISYSTIDAEFTSDQLVVTWNPLQGWAYPPLLATYDWKGQLVTEPIVVADDTGRNYVNSSVDAWEGGAAVVFHGGFNGRPYAGPDVRDGDQEGVFLRRFCLANDPQCLCPLGVDDMDLDGLADECDLCSNANGARDAVAASVSVTTATELLSTSFENSVSLKLDAWLPAGTDFHSLPLLAEGLRVRIEAATSLAPGGATVVDFAVPPGLYSDDEARGWIEEAHVFRYRDRSSAWDNGLEGVTVRERANGGVRVVLHARTGHYGVKASDPPLRAIVSFGMPVGGGNACAEAVFPAETCGADIQGAVSCSFP